MKESVALESFNIACTRFAESMMRTAAEMERFEMTAQHLGATLGMVKRWKQEASNRHGPMMRFLWYRLLSGDWG